MSTAPNNPTESLAVAFLEYAPVGAMVLGEDGRILYLNPAFTELTGYALADLPDIEAWFQRAYPDEAQRDAVRAAYLEQLREERRPGDVVHEDVVRQIACRDGQRRVIRLLANRVEGGKVFVSALDVTRTAEAERSRLEIGDRYQKLVEELGVGIIVHSGGVIRFANRWVVEMCRARSIDEIVGRSIYDFVDPSLQQIVRDRVERGYDGASLPPIEEPLKRADGTTFWGGISGSPVVFDGEPALQLAIIDVSERRRAEEERRRLEAELEAARKLESLGVLAGGVAHDFNNLLVGILGGADLVARALPKGSELAASVERIQSAAERAAELARQMLAYSGRGQFFVDAVDLSELVGQMAPLVSAAVGKDARILYELASDLPPVQADATQLRQVIMNLLRNAVDALPEGVGTVVVRTGTERGSDRELAFFEVEDDGVGMDDRVKQSMFDPFFSTKMSGHGLGLAAVQGIVRGHGGAVEVETALGYGTRIRCRFPAASPELRTAAQSDAPGRAPAPSAGPREGMVLVVDDEEDVRHVATAMLRALGYQATAVDTGPRALDYLRRAEEPVRCVLLDLSMPGMDGVALSRILHERWPRLPILLSSGYDRDEALERGRDVVFSGFLRKPYHLEDLEDALAQAIATLD
jgi:two-component system cell cycle sensor histidine kinase/response regulator CckA